MKLKTIYVWIEKFKNIEQEGFNLSGDFYIEKIENNKFYIKKFNNILYYHPFINIKAFVGKNGSGKSAILEFLLLYLSNLNISKHLKGFLIILDEDKNIFYIKNYGTDISIKHIELDESIKENYELKNLNEFHSNLEKYLYNIFINYAIDYPSTTFWEVIKLNNLRLNEPFYINRRKNFVLSPIKSWNKINIDILYKEFANDYFFIRREFDLSDDEIEKLIQENFEDENFTFYPEKFKLGLNKIKYIFKIEGILTSQRKINIDYLFRAFKENKFDLFILDEQNMNNTRKKLVLLGLIYIYFQYKLYNQGDELSNLLYYALKYLTALTENFNKNLYNKLLRITSLIIKISIDTDSLNENRNSLKVIFSKWKRELSVYKSDEPIIEYMEYILNDKSSINLFKEYKKYDLSDIPLTNLLLNLPDFMDIYLIDKANRSFNDLSFGEKLLNFLLLKILRAIKEAQDKYSDKISTINLLYDEFDIGLHPEMQRKFVNFLINITEFVNKNLKQNLYFNIFISTHSPFIVSDIPKSNISFIENGKEKEEFEENENTFGANLYDILAKGFFLKNSIGLYSERFIKALSTMLTLIFAIKYYKKYNDDFLLRRLEERLREDLKKEISLKEIFEKNRKNFIEFLEKDKVIDKEFLPFFIKKDLNKNEINEIDQILQKEQIKFYIEHLIGEPIIRKNLEEIFNKINSL